MSIQDQLLKAGLIDKNKHRQEKTAKRKKAKQPTVDDDAATASRNAQQSLAEKNRRDRELNRSNREAAQKKAITAQIRQLIDNNEVASGEQDVAYSFSDGKVVKKINISAESAAAISNGKLAVVNRNAESSANNNNQSGNAPSYAVVPRAVAAKIVERNPAFVVVLHDRPVGEAPSRDAEGEDDPYANYEIPDDLMW